MIEVTGIILAGGKSTRMGTEKGLVKINQKKMIEHTIEQLHRLTKNIIIIANSDKYDYLDIPVYKDLIKDIGPIGGIYTGLFYSKTNFNIILSCDTPFIKSEILETLVQNIDENDIYISCVGNEQHPLCGLYSKKILKQLKTHIDNNELKLKSILNNFKTKFIFLKEDADLRNLNSPFDLIEASINKSLWK